MIHPTAIIDPKAEIGEGVQIGPYSVIEKDVSIGEGTRIGPHVVIREGTHIGKQCQIFGESILARRWRTKSGQFLIHHQCGLPFLAFHRRIPGLIEPPAAVGIH